MKDKPKTLIAASVIALSALGGCSTANVLAGGEEIAVVEAQTSINAVTAGAVTVASGTVATTTQTNAEDHASADDYVWDESEVVEVSLDGEITSDGDGVLIESSRVTITAAGTYRINGTLSDGQIVVDAGDEAVVRLILDDTRITNNTGAAIAVMTAEKAVVILADGTENTLTDAAMYVFAEGEDEPNAALYSASDLTIGGEGSLTVYGAYNDGITSKDGLIIDAGNISVEAVDDGIRGKDYVVVSGGTLDITAGGDGIKADNEEDADRGYIGVADGIVDITAGGDAIQAETDVVITGGDIAVAAGGGSTASLGADDSAKGIKGAVSVVIEGGTVTVDAADDAIHSNVAILINGGSIDVATGDDAIHADENVEVNGGIITIAESYEGIEAAVITINDGDIRLTASDDGLNVAGGSDGPGELTADGTESADPFGPRGGGPGGPGGDPGAGGAESVGDYHIYINGGTIVIDSVGDGIDSNGDVVMTGGTVVVSAATNGRDNAVDSNGTFEMLGGTLVGTNVDGRVSEGVEGTSTQGAIYLTTSSIYAAGTVVHFETTDGDGVLTFETSKDFSVVVFSSPDLVAGETYDVYVDGSTSGESISGLYGSDAYDPGTLVGTVTAS
jgi:hypothetical protein